MSDEAPTTPRPSPEHVAEEGELAKCIQGVIDTEDKANRRVWVGFLLTEIRRAIAARDRSWEEEVAVARLEEATLWETHHGWNSRCVGRVEALEAALERLRAELQREREKGTRE
jgi:hypothetical protein